MKARAWASIPLDVEARSDALMERPRLGRPALRAEQQAPCDVRVASGIAFGSMAPAPGTPAANVRDP
jgi:hypothetical protein